MSGAEAAGDRRAVLFVCMGNICRSPAAEAVLRHLVTERGLGARVEVDSAGTIGYHAGEPPDARMRQAGERRGYRLEGRARELEPADLERFDLVVAMDRDNLQGIESVRDSDGDAVGGATVHLLSDFLAAGSPVDVPDPYYGGGGGFERVLDLLEEACPALLDHLVPDSP